MLEGNQDNNSVEYGGNEGVYISSNGTWDANATNTDAHSYIKILGTNTDGQGLLDMGSDTINTYSTADTTITIDSDNNDTGAFFLKDGAVTLIDSEQTNTVISTSSGSSLDVGQTTVAITNAGLSVSGATTLSSTLGVTGTSTLSGATTVDDTLNVTGATDLDSTLNVDGATTTAGITNTGGLSQSGATSITGTTTINTTGTAGTSVGNTTGTVGITGSTTTLNGGTNATVGLTTDSATMLVGTKGLTINGATDVTTLSGGTNTSTLTLQDGSATLAVGGSSGAPVTLINATTAADSTSPAITLGAAGSSTNTLTGATNNITATTANNLTGTTNVNLSVNSATSINTGTSTGAVTIGNVANTTSLNSSTNNIGVSSTYATANNMGTNAAFSSINTIGNTNAASTVSTYGGAGYTTVNNTLSTMGTGTGGMVQTSASTATMRASSSGSLATNGTTGTMTVGAGGGYTTYATTQNTGTGTTIGGVVDDKDYTNKINGSLFVDGNVYINGTLDYVSSNSANTTVIGSGTGTSILPDATQGTLGGTAIVMKDSTGLQTQVDANGRLTNVSGAATESTVAMTLTNGYGEVHGMVVTEYQTTISGGTRSSSLTLDDNGATFSNSATGAPVQVHGVADGTGDFDAINVRQLGGAIASVSAMANIPQVEQGKTYSMGGGYGYYMGKSALALGGTYRMRENAVLKASVASGLNNGKKTTVGVGAAFSW